MHDCDQMYAWSGLYLDGNIISLHSGAVSSFSSLQLKSSGFDPKLGLLSVG